ncbi:MAG: ATP-binding cassette domain-containing protein [Clostridia bacterium]|nr:ATP-binding cassette domain-containing protein [Clostridia bacterium]
MNLIQIRKLSTTYNGHIAIKDISLDIKPGEYICLVGENGSGKSTLLKTIVGLNKKDSGDITKNIAPEKISYLAQNNMIDLDFPATAKEIIMTGVQMRGRLPFYKKQDYENLKQICELLGIKDLMNRQIGELSGGQRQRVMLARALIRNPELLILDEPCSGLDVNVTKELYDILEKFNKETGLTIIMATHDLDEIKTEKVRVVCLATTVKFDGDIKDWKGL